ncbi:mucin-13 isoform X5 [Motacilla alba alba]|uniref:mucin-13 isoform X5 n=1 Tax=Motacilla alba alba TaxID=1094192 RepID=UPI0018D56396|nr:mucin-13 isoform X5 [Motacilla alba alba]
MRRSVFFAVCLGLVLSLLKEAPAETSAGTTVTPSSIPTGNSTDTETASESPAVTPSERAGNGTDSGTEPDPPEVKPTEPSGNGTDSGTEPDPPEVKPTEPSGNGTGNGTEPDPPEVKPTEPSGNGTDSGTEPDPPEVKPTEPSGNGTDSGTEPDPPEVKPTEPSGNGTGNGTKPDPPVVEPTEPSGNGTGNGTKPDPPVVEPTEPSGNGTGNGTKPDPPVVEPTEPSGNGTGNGTKPDPPVVEPTEPSGNGTGNGTKPDPPVVEPTEPSGNGTGNGTKPDPPVVEPTEPSGNGTGNGTKPDPPVVEPTEPSGNSTVNGTDPDATSTPTVDFCHGDPCRTSSATCVSLQSSYMCVCQYGYYYTNENCYKGKIYPVSIAVNASYSENLQIANSTEFQELLNNVTEFFREAFKHLSGYTETVIRKIQPLKESRNAAPGLNVTVTNLFTKNSSVTKATVSAAIKKAIENDPSFVGSWEEGRHCDIYKCDLRTTTCVEEKGEEEGEEFPECKCKPDLEKTEWDDRSCSVCSQNCSAAKHKYCVQEEGGPTCKCMINFKKEAGECVACSVGYSGEDCTDNSELILIIVGTVFGAIILCLVIAVSVVSVRAKHKQNPEKRSLIKSGYSDMNTSEDRPSMFPRVQTTSGHANPGYQPNNPYEMRSANRDRFPERDYDDLYEISREPMGFRTQSRY